MSSHISSFTTQRDPQKVGDVIKTMFIPYKGSTIIRVSDNEFVFHGKTYPTLEDAKNSFGESLKALYNSIK